MEIETSTTPDSKFAKYRWIGYTFIIGLLFVVFEHQYTHLERQVRFVDEDEIEEILSEAAETGSRSRQLGVLGVGVLGIYAFSVSRRKLQLSNPFLLAALAYVGWATLSVTWSEEAGLTIKRLIVLYCLIIGAAGLARALRPSQIALVTLIICIAYILVGLAGEIALGGFRPWGAEYRFRGTVHPNVQAAYTAFCCLATYFLRKHYPAYSNLFNAIFVCAAAALFLTKSRMALVAFIVALGLTILLQSSIRRMLLFATFGSVLTGFVLLVFGLGGARLMDKSTDAALLGRTEQTGSFSGRTPLWEEIMEYVDKKPMTGYAYASFWVPDRIEVIKKHQEWAIDSSHSIYFETLGDLGYVGLGILLVGAFLALAYSIILTRRYPDDGGYAFVTAILLYSLLHGLMESHYVKPFFVTFIAGCCLLSITLFRSDQTADTSTSNYQPQRLPQAAN